MSERELKGLDWQLPYFERTEREAYHLFTAVAANAELRRSVTRQLTAGIFRRHVYRGIPLQVDPAGFAGSWSAHLSQEMTCSPVCAVLTNDSATYSGHRLVVKDTVEGDEVFVTEDFRRPMLRIGTNLGMPMIELANPVALLDGELEQNMHDQARYMAWLGLVHEAIGSEIDLLP